MGDLHDRIVGILAELCKDCKRESGKPYYEEVYADHTEGFENKPLPITLVRRGRSLIENFYPDVWAERPRGRIDIFEVWHSENESDAVNDLLFSALVKGIKYLHVVCTGHGITKSRAKKLSDIILNKLYNRKGTHLLSPDDVYFADVPEEIRGDRAEIEKRLRRQLKF